MKTLENILLDVGDHWFIFVSRTLTQTSEKQDMKYVCLRGWSGPRHARAVSLIELVGAVIVAMILMHIAPPAYKKFIAQAHANNALQSARSLMPYLVELHGQHGTFEIIDISSVTSEGGVITANGQQTGMLLPN